MPVDSNVELKSEKNQILPLHPLTSVFLSCILMLHSHMSASAITSSSSFIPATLCMCFRFLPAYSFFLSTIYVSYDKHIPLSIFDHLNRIYRAAPGYWISVPFSQLLKMMIIIKVIMATTKAAGAAEILRDVAPKFTFMHLFLLVLCFIF